MIYDFALEPELVAQWHDRRVAYPYLCQMGRGHCRVPCIFPFAGWAKLVIEAAKAEYGHDTVTWQRVKKHLEALLTHLKDVGTRRNGRLENGEVWLTAAEREHDAYPFGGILVREAVGGRAHVISADHLHDRVNLCWCPVTPPVKRQASALADALAPLLRSAAEVWFIDPYFDAALPAFGTPMIEYLAKAQQRRTVSELRLQTHLWVSAKDVSFYKGLGLANDEAQVAELKLAECEAQLKQHLKSGVRMRVFAWGMPKTGLVLHNRYVLTDVGGVLVPSGLDECKRSVEQTDDLTVLSAEQLLERRAEVSPGTQVYKALATRKF